MELDRNLAVVHLEHILHNYQLLKQQVGKSRVMAVVKADAYGHGSVEVARMLEEHGCKYFAVASLQEAIELREGDVSGDILIFGRTSIENAKYLKQYDLIQTLYSLDYARQLNETNIPIRAHINVDTGMSRFGLFLHDEQDLERIADEVEAIDQMPHLILEGIYTHFANSDETQSGFCQMQYSLFRKLIEMIEERRIFLIRHAANSSATLAFPNTYLDMVRVGIAMYGYPPVETDLPFKPGMEVLAKVTSTRMVGERDSVSYGRTYSPKETMKIATIAIGYADGYNRLLSNSDDLYYKGKLLPVIGRVCMDAIMIDAKDTGLQDGELVEVFGMNKDLKKMCETLKTIPYEILCNVSKRVPRIYQKG